MKRRETLDKSTVTINGKKKTLREHLVATEGKADSQEFTKESGRFVGTLAKGKPKPSKLSKPKAVPTKPKAIYSRQFTQSEIAEEEVKLMASQSLKTLQFMLAHPNEWYTSKQVCEGIGEEPRTASPTVSRIITFFKETEPEAMITRQVGRAREMMFKAVADDVDEWSQKYNDQYIKWLRVYTKAQREGRVGKGKWPRKVTDKLKEQREERGEPEKQGTTAAEIEAGMRSFLPGEKLTIEVKGSIKILFGFVRSEK